LPPVYGTLECQAFGKGINMVSKLVHNEQIKLLATYCNNVGVAAITVGATAPLFAQDVNFTRSAILGGIMAAVAQFAGRMTLRWLRE
jgi:hypothetical protein